MKRILVALFLIAGLFVVAVSPVKADQQKSTVRGAASAAKDVSTGVLSDGRRLGRVVLFPLRHPKRTAHAIGTGIKDAGIGVLTVFVQIIGPGVPR